MVGMRLGLSIVIVTAVIFEGLRNQMHFTALVILGALLFVITQTDKIQTQRLRKQTILDLATLITVMPVAILNGFVAAEPGSLLPAERSALLQTGGGLLIAVTVSIWLATYLFVSDRALLPAVALPGLMVVLTTNFVLHDYRNQTVLAMIAVSYFFGAAAVALSALVDEPARRYFPAALFGTMILAGIALFNPGLLNVFERDPLVQVITAMMILIGMVFLVAAPNPAIDLMGSPRGRTTREVTASSPKWRDSNGPGSNVER
jgi:hypothetical protein